VTAPLGSICVYASSSQELAREYVDAARALGAELATSGRRLVFGGGRAGLMGAVADAMLEAGGEVIGVIPRQLDAVEISHTGVTELIVVESMHERKQRMADNADAFVALPGGIGTLEELIEVWTWTQLGYHTKPCALLNVRGYYDDLIGFLDHAVSEGFLSPESRELLIVSDDPADLLRLLDEARPPAHKRLVDQSGL
jgi:uncharacterized protein (TIGR00730 family)